MTAITKYERLEAPGIWRASQDEQRRDVILSLGDATLTLSDMQERALTHWSLPAIIRLNPSERPAVFAPGEDATEELELDDETMIKAIEKVRNVVAKRRPHPGRLRHVLTIGLLVALVGLAVFWLPGALRNYTASVLPDPTRAALGQRILDRAVRVAGTQCVAHSGRAALDQLSRRTLGPEAPKKIVVLSSGVQATAHLPGNIFLVNRALIEDYEEPDVLAGFLIAERLREQAMDPALALLEHAGLISTAKLLTTGDMPNSVIDNYAETMLLATPEPIENARLLTRFKDAKIRSTPYAYAVDLSGETTLELIEADPVPLAEAEPLLTDASWVSLQGICGE